MFRKGYSSTRSMNFFLFPILFFWEKWKTVFLSMSYINVCCEGRDSMSVVNERFQAEVNKKLSEGYKPTGGVSSTHTAVEYTEGYERGFFYHAYSFSQAMYKSDP
jgi:hypothetical protein